jgi:hypothetical protein
MIRKANQRKRSMLTTSRTKHYKPYFDHSQQRCHVKGPIRGGGEDDKVTPSPIAIINGGGPDVACCCCCNLSPLPPHIEHLALLTDAPPRSNTDNGQKEALRCPMPALVLPREDGPVLVLLSRPPTDALRSKHLQRRVVGADMPVPPGHGEIIHQSWACHGIHCPRR